MEILFLIVGAILGFGIGFLYCRMVSKNHISPDSLKENYITKDLLFEVKNRNAFLEQKNEFKENEIVELNKIISAQEQLIDSLREQADFQNAEMHKQRELMKNEFELLSGRLLEEKGKKIIMHNQEQIGYLLNPLKEKLIEFEKKVEHFYVDDSRQRAVLAEQIRSLTELNRMVTAEAHNLTKALKGDSKIQGNWGEMILERILEISGLTKGREFLVQPSFSTDEGRRFQPDVVICLPFERHLIIDSKVSLRAYEKYSSSSDEKEKQIFLKEHLTSLKRHIEELSAKNYQLLDGINPPDYVLMFIPIEPAFSLALYSDSDFMYEAMRKNIIPLSPGTLLATLRTVSNLWRQDLQSKNAMLIAKQGGLLYDKLVGWVEELEQIGEKIQYLQNSYHQSVQKLVTGKGNLIQRASKLKELGAKTSKAIPELFGAEDERG